MSKIGRIHEKNHLEKELSVHIKIRICGRSSRKARTKLSCGLPKRFRKEERKQKSAKLDLRKKALYIIFVEKHSAKTFVEWMLFSHAQKVTVSQEYRQCDPVLVSPIPGYWQSCTQTQVKEV